MDRVHTFNLAELEDPMTAYVHRMDLFVALALNPGTDLPVRNNSSAGLIRQAQQIGGMVGVTV